MRGQVRQRHVLLDVDSPHVGRLLALSDKVDHHIRGVLRMRDGSTVSVTNGSGGYGSGVLAPDGVELASWSQAPHPRTVTLLPGLSKANKLDLVVEKATELGVARIVPMDCVRSERTWGPDALKRRMTRWETITQSALEQSGGFWLPKIEDPVTLGEALERWQGIILDPSGEVSLSDTLTHAESATIAVGPEGGFDTSELAAAASSGWQIAHMGPRILRTETAAIVATALAAASVGLLAQRDQTPVDL